MTRPATRYAYQSSVYEISRPHQACNREGRLAHHRPAIRDAPSRYLRGASQTALAGAAAAVQPSWLLRATKCCRLSRAACSLDPAPSPPAPQIYHCPYCNLCRRGAGLGLDACHCMQCNCCMHLTEFSRHKCRDLSTCPVCTEYLFDSNQPYRVRAVPLLLESVGCAADTCLAFGDLGHT